MIEYIYRGFKISYTVEQQTQETTSFKAKGYVTYLLSVPKSFEPANLYAEYTTHAGAEHTIRLLLENHINVELKTFYDRKKELVLGRASSV